MNDHTEFELNMMTDFVCVCVCKFYPFNFAKTLKKVKGTGNVISGKAHPVFRP